MTMSLNTSPEKKASKQSVHAISILLTIFPNIALLKLCMFKDHWFWDCHWMGQMLFLTHMFIKKKLINKYTTCCHSHVLFETWSITSGRLHYAGFFTSWGEYKCNIGLLVAQFGRENKYEECDTLDYQDSDTENSCVLGWYPVMWETDTNVLEEILIPYRSWSQFPLQW